MPDASIHPMVHPAAVDDQALLAQCSVTHKRASGPGGQHRNKVETAVTLRHEPTGVTGYASERRSKQENLRMATFRLRVNLALQVRMPVRPEQPVSELWKSRVKHGRIALNPTHHDFPAMLAEALDTLAAARMDPAAAAPALGCTMTQFVNLLKDEPRALAVLNEHRRLQGLKPLR